MNKALLDPFARKQYPELLETYIYEPGSFGMICKFNRRGALLASGCHNGLVVVWDFMTRSKAGTLKSHAMPITGLSWSYNQRQLLSSSLDAQVILWNVEAGIADKSFNAAEPVLNSQIHPRNSRFCALAFHGRPPEEMDLETGATRPVPTSGPVGALLGALSYNRDGSKLYWGDNAGKIHVVDTATWKEVEETSVGSDTIGIKQIVFNHQGTMILANCNDRKIRCYSVDSMETAPRILVDPVKRNMWKTCRFSNNGEFVIAGSADKAEHHIYIWDRDNGLLVKNIEGPKEGILDLQWHPLSPVICSCAASSGVIFIWTTNYTEHWSAYAPNFTELAENEIYVEKEDEFDEMDSEEHVAVKRQKQEEAEEADVDILTMDPIEGLSSEEEDHLMALSANAGTQ